MEMVQMCEETVRYLNFLRSIAIFRGYIVVCNDFFRYVGFEGA